VDPQLIFDSFRAIARTGAALQKPLIIKVSHEFYPAPDKIRGQIGK